MDLHFLTQEFKNLSDSRVDKIHHPQKELVVLSFYKTNQGKKVLVIDLMHSPYLSDKKIESSQTLNFGMVLRKYLDGYFLLDICQVDSERILKLSFKSKNDKKTLYLEFFGKGNMILCDEEGTIINSLDHHEFKDRTIKPKSSYKHPRLKINFLDMKKPDLKKLALESKKETMVVCLATEIGLGGLFAEEVCLVSGIDKNIMPSKASDEDVSLIFESIIQIAKSKLNPSIAVQDDKFLDFAPFELKTYENLEKKHFPSFSEAIEVFYSQPDERKTNKKLAGLIRIIEEQKAAISRLAEEEVELRHKGELIYHRYSLIKDLIDQLNHAAKKYSFKEIKAKLKENKIIKEVNEAEKKIIIELD